MELFASLSTTVILLILLASFFAMGKAADLVVTAIVKLSGAFHIRPFALSFVLLGVTTSLPEALIGAFAVIDGIPRLSLGNLLGGVIVLFTLVIGINGLVFGGILTDGKLARYSLCKILPYVPLCRRVMIYDVGTLSVLFLAPALLLIDGSLSRIDGFILIVLYLLIVWYYLKMQGRSQTVDSKKIHPAKYGLFFLLGAGLLVIIARVVVVASEVVLQRYHVPPFLFGLLMLSIGTNLPEITVMLRARGSLRDISIGNALGSAAANVLLIGVLMAVSPLRNLSAAPFQFTIGMLILSTVILMVFMRTRDRLSRFESGMLIIMYLLFFAFLGLFSVRVG